MNQKIKTRLVRLQEQLTIARLALRKIANGGRDPMGIAETAIEEIQAGDLKAGGNPDKFNT